MPANDFIPRRQADLQNWASNFLNTIQSTAGHFNLSAQQLADLTLVTEAYRDLYFAAASPMTRTPSIVQAKKSAQKNLIRTARKVAAQIRAQQSTTTPQLRALGLSTRKPGGYYPRIPTPTTAPNIHIIDVSPPRMTILLKDPERPTSRGIPPQMRGATLFYHIGLGPLTNHTQWSFFKDTSRARRTFEMPGEAAVGLQNGHQLWLVAQWVTQKAQRGPMSLPISILGTPIALHSYGITRNKAA